MLENSDICHLACASHNIRSIASVLAIAEALAYGLPIVATDIGAIPELVTDRVNGLLVPIKNSQAIADGVEKLINDDNLRAEFAKNNLSKAKNLASWDTFDSVLDTELVPLIDRLLTK